VASLMRGRVATALRAHPFGAAAGLALMVLALFGVVEAATGRRALRRLRPGAWWAWAVVIGLPVGWGLKILIGLAEGTLPMR
jgi:hypothetical protein